MTEVIGRATEGHAIARFAGRVPEGPAGLVIEGEPGIGKTTVLSEAVRVAESVGYHVLRAGPAQSEAELSFAALDDLIGPVFAEVSDSLPLPQRQALEGALLRRVTEHPVDPRLLGVALVGILTKLTAERPIVLAIDDAQWLDPPSERVFRFAARRLPRRAGVVVASRTSEAEAPLDLDRTLNPDRLEHLLLGPLSLGTLHHLVHQAVSIKLPRPVLVRLAEASRGNPFYALEIARMIARDARAPSVGDPMPLSGVLQDLVQGRLQQLSARAREAALAAAALSQPTGESVAAALGPEVDTTAALVDAEDAGILRWDGERLRFSHPLLASGIYGSASSGRRRALHRRLAEVVVDREERARHLARSLTSADESAAREIEEAAELAERRGAPEAAAELFEAARRLTPAAGGQDLPRRMLGGARALSIAGDLRGATALAMEALNAGLAGSLRARALLLLGSMATYTATIESRLAYQEEALVEAGDDPRLRVEILLALFEQFTVDAEKAARFADEAVVLADGLHDPDFLSHTLIQRFIAESVLGRGPDPRVLDEALAMEASSGHGAGSTTIYPLIWSHWIDDLDATRAHYRRQAEVSANLGDPVGAAEIVEFLAMAEFRAGNWELAERILEEACATLAQFELRGPVTASFADRSVIDAHRGRAERARTTLTDALGATGPDVFWRMVCHSAQGAVEFCAGNYEGADRAWAAMREEAGLIGWKDNLDDRSEPDHIETLLRLGRLEEARLVLRHLEWRGRTLPRPWIDATLPRARALILAAEENLPAAIGVLDAAPDIPALPFERGRLLFARGQIERRANRKLAAQTSLSAALSTFERLGSPPWVQRTGIEMARLGLRHRPRDELSATERRIAELAATGMTNREVAQALFVSPKTVEANLARIYGKLGIGSRAELGARMSAESGGGAGQT